MTERSHEVNGLGSELFYGSRYHAPMVHVCLERIVAQVTSTWSQQPLQGVLDTSVWQTSASVGRPPASQAAISASGS